jgi:adenylate cyclase
MSETRKLAAILVSDVVGYSRLAGADEDRILARLRTLRSDLIDPTIAVHHGRIVKRTGDGSIIEFRSVVDAVNCAIEVQRAMVDRNAEVAPDKRIEFRIGIHLGDVVEESDGDLMGDGVNIAARLEGIAKPGAICLSEDAYRQVKGRLDLSIADLGPKQLKNIAEPVRAYAVEVGVRAKSRPFGRSVSQRRRLALAVGLVAVLALAGAAAIAWRYAAASRMALKPGEAGIVVLPFDNLSGDASEDYVAEALTNGLTEGLAGANGFLVIANRTAKTYKGKPIDVKEIGKELGVHFVLDGSVQPAANGVRVNVQLIDAETGAQLWADRFDHERMDLVEMEDDIDARLLHELAGRLYGIQAARAARARPDNPEAQDLANRCYANVIDHPQAYNDPRTRAGLYEPCHRALTLDPRNVLALKLRALELLDGITRGGSVDQAGDLKRAREAVETALAVDAFDPGAHTLDAYVLSVEGQPDQAIAEAERSLTLNQSFVSAYLYLCPALIQSGQLDKALACIDKETRISPRDPIMFEFLHEKAEALQALGRDSETLDVMQRSLNLLPDHSAVRLLQVAVLSNLGRDAEARDALQGYMSSAGPKQFKTIAEYEAFYSKLWPLDRPILKSALKRRLDGLRKAGMPEGEAKTN